MRSSLNTCYLKSVLIWRWKKPFGHWWTGQTRQTMPVIAPPKRYVLSGMIFVGFFVMSGLRVNLNVAIGAMVKNHTAVVDGQTICRVSLYKKYSSIYVPFMINVLLWTLFSHYNYVYIQRKVGYKLFPTSLVLEIRTHFKTETLNNRWYIVWRNWTLSRI